MKKSELKKLIKESYLREISSTEANAQFMEMVEHQKQILNILKELENGADLNAAVGEIKKEIKKTLTKVKNLKQIKSLRENNESNYFVYDRSGKKLATGLTPEEAKQFVVDNQRFYKFPLAWTEDTRGTFNINKDDEMLPISEQEDDTDIEDIEDEFEAEPAVAQDGESKNQESAPRKRINFENRELEMLVDVNKNATKKGIKIQFLSDDELSKEERTKLVSSLQTYLDEGLAKFVKGAKLNVDSDQDVPNKTKTVGFTIKIGDVFGLVSKVFANRGDDEEGGEEVEAEETEVEETEELQELRRQIRGFLKEEQMEMSFKTFEDVKNDMSEFPGFQEIVGGFSLPIEGIMGDTLGGSYEFTENPDQTVKVTKVDGEGNELSSKSHPIDIIVGFLEKY